MPTFPRLEYLVVNSIVLSTPAWEATDLSGLRDAAVVRGENRVIPYKPGRQPLPRVKDEFRTLIPILVNGDFDPDGDTYADPIMGLDLNLDILREEIFSKCEEGDGTVPIIWHRRDGSEYTADGMALPPFHPESHDAMTMKIVMDLCLPSGEFVEAASS
jgi:hypothetical protein